MGPLGGEVGLEKHTLTKKAGFWTFGLPNRRVVRRSFFGLLALSFGFSTEHSFYYEIDATNKTKLQLVLKRYRKNLNRKKT